MREEPALLAVVVYIIRPEAPAVHGVLVVRLALVEARVLLGRGVDLHLGLDGVVADRPLVYLRQGGPSLALSLGGEARSLVEHVFAWISSRDYPLTWKKLW